MTNQVIGWAIIHSLWQGGIIALIAACLFTLARGLPPVVRYTIGLIALVVAAVLPVMTAVRGSDTTLVTQDGSALLNRSPADSRLSITLPGRGLSSANISIGDTPPQPESSSARFDAGVSSIRSKIATSWKQYADVALPWIVLAWICGLVLVSVRMAAGVVRTRQIARRGTSIARSEILARVEVLSSRLGITRAIRVLESVRVDVPLVIGALRPLVVVPVSVVSGISPMQLDMLLAHELAHVRRHDFLVNVVQTLIESFMFYHPGIRWLSERVREERENCCDDIAMLAVGGDAHEYTAALLALEESRADFGLAAAATDGSLLRRARRLITGTTPHVELGSRWVAGVLTIAAVLLTGRDAIGSTVASFTPVPVIAAAPKDDSVKKWHVVPDPSRAGPGRISMAPRTMSFADRMRWAESAARGQETYWVGYVIAGPASGARRYYSDDIPVSLGRGTSMSGNMTFRDGDLSSMTFSGVPLAPIFGNHRPQSNAVFILMNDPAKPVRRIHVGSYDIPMYFDRQPVMWLDSANDAESIQLIESLRTRRQTENIARELVNAIGAHNDASVVIPHLREVVRMGATDGVRREALEGIGRLGGPTAVVMLASIARSDRSSSVRQAAIEAMRSMDSPSATDTLIALASSLVETREKRATIEALGDREDSRALNYVKELAKDGRQAQSMRNEALDALANRGDGPALQTLLDIARNDASASVRRQALQSLAEFPDKAAMDALVQAAHLERDEELQRAALSALGDSKNASGLKAVESMSRNGETATLQRLALQVYVDQARPSSVLAYLKEIIAGNDDEARKLRAIQYLADTNDPAGITVLEDIARHNSNPRLRRKALQVLTDR